MALLRNSAYGDVYIYDDGEKMWKFFYKIEPLPNDDNEISEGYFDSRDDIIDD